MSFQNVGHKPAYHPPQNPQIKPDPKNQFTDPRSKTQSSQSAAETAVNGMNSATDAYALMAENEINKLSQDNPKRKELQNKLDLFKEKIKKYQADTSPTDLKKAMKGAELLKEGIELIGEAHTEWGKEHPDIAAKEDAAMREALKNNGPLSGGTGSLSGKK